MVEPGFKQLNMSEHFFLSVKMSVSIVFAQGVSIFRNEHHMGKREQAVHRAPGAKELWKKKMTVAAWEDLQ